MTTYSQCPECDKLNEKNANGTECSNCGYVYGVKKVDCTPYIRAFMDSDKWTKMHTPKSRGGTAPEINTFGMGTPKGGNRYREDS